MCTGFIIYILDNISSFLIFTNTYWVIFGRAVISGGAEDNSRQEKSQQKCQQPEGKLFLDHMISI